MSTCFSTEVPLHFAVNNIDAEYKPLTGLSEATLLENHLWGDKEFSAIDPNSNSVYIYSDRKPSEDFTQYVKDQQVASPDSTGEQGVTQIKE